MVKMGLLHPSFLVPFTNSNILNFWKCARPSSGPFTGLLVPQGSVLLIYVLLEETNSWSFWPIQKQFILFDDAEHWLFPEPQAQSTARCSTRYSGQLASDSSFPWLVRQRLFFSKFWILRYFGRFCLASYANWCFSVLYHWKKFTRTSPLVIFFQYSFELPGSKRSVRLERDSDGKWDACLQSCDDAYQSSFDIPHLADRNTSEVNLQLHCVQKGTSSSHNIHSSWSWHVKIPPPPVRFCKSKTFPDFAIGWSCHEKYHSGGNRQLDGSWCTETAGHVRVVRLPVSGKCSV